MLPRPYNFTETRLVIQEMVNSLALQLTKQNLVTDQVALRVAYDVSNISEDYQGPLVTDFYGRQAPKPMHGKANLSLPTFIWYRINGGIYEAIWILALTAD